jgi:membrane-associated phospholipid phosphatase
MARADTVACRWLRSRPHRPAVDRLLAASSRLTDDAAGWIVLGITATMLQRRRRAGWLAWIVTVAAADRASVALKHVVARPRPRLEGLPPLAFTPSPLSFPSSHTASAIAAAVAARPLVQTRSLYAEAAAIGLSRPYLGVHYPSDVLAGAAIGAAVGRIGRPAIERLARSRNRQAVSRSTAPSGNVPAVR